MIVKAKFKKSVKSKSCKALSSKKFCRLNFSKDKIKLNSYSTTLPPSVSQSKVISGKPEKSTESVKVTSHVPSVS